MSLCQWHTLYGLVCGSGEQMSTCLSVSFIYEDSKARD